MKKRKKILWLLLLWSFSASLFFIPRFLPVNKIDCQSQYGPCSDLLQSGLNNLQLNNLYQSKRVVNQYLQQQSEVEKYTLRFNLPNEIKIYLVERKPLYAIKNRNGEYYLVDRDGLILKKVTITSLPFIEDMTAMTETTGKTNKDQHFALQLLTYMDYLYDLSQGKLTDSGVEFTLRDRMLVIFPREGDAEVLIGSLRLIVENIANNTGEFSLEKNSNQITIDLRYKNPVIK